jgi:CheY-like chemotaxis protein
MNGWEFRRELGRDPGYSGTPVVIMSGGHLRPSDLAGCADWISKPVHGPSLLQKLERCTRQTTPVR